jgi:predicted unusual protein kinase regulating ubiquinone biosynthesis (AarF/ABC1/UbiB family)
MASYVDGFMPGEHGEVYEAVMGKLRTSTPTSPPAAIRAIVEEELKKPVGELFATWDEEPFASASLGQVHRATLADGRVVAVKVQHAGIEAALESDLKNISMLESLVRPLASQKIDSRAIVQNLVTRFREELDYELEAKHQRRFAKLHEGDPQIRIPAIVDERSSRRVLTSELAEGMTLAEAGRQSESLRRTYAETMWRFVFRGNFVGRIFNTDPHPGNYVFQPDGKVVFLDFGCVQPLTDHMFTHGFAQYKSALAKDEVAFVEATAEYFRTNQDCLNEHTRNCFEPLFASPFRITRKYAGDLLKESGDVAKKAKGKSEAPPELPLFNRLQFGFYSVLARLDVTADYAAASRAVLAEEEAASLATAS